MAKEQIAILIPCYNESKTIEKVVKDYKSVLPFIFVPTTSPCST